MTVVTKTLLTLGAVAALAACAPKPKEAAVLVDPYAGRVQTPAPTAPVADFSSVTDVVQFAQDQSTLDGPARGILDGQAAWLTANPTYRATVEGHADEQGTREYNLALGARRASSVQQYLVAQGVAPVRIKTVSYGKERPLEVCSTEVCFAKNRRAVTRVSQGVGS